MKKKVFGRKLSRDFGSRKALFRSLVRSLVKHGSIRTTKAKAKAIQGEVDRYVNLAKAGSVTSRRRLLELLGNDRVTTESIIGIVKSSFLQRTGGYTRIVNLPVRRGDAAEIVKLEWTEEIGVDEKGKKRKSKKDTKGQPKANRSEKVKSRLSRKRSTGKKVEKK